MIRKNLIAMVGVMAMAAMIQTAQASISLADLVANNGTLTIDHKLFSDFSFTDSGLTGFDANLIKVTATDVGGVEYLTWSGNISLVSAIGATADLKLNYKVTVIPGGKLIDWIDQSYTGSVQPAGGGFIAVDENAYVGAVVVGNSHLQVGDLSDPWAEAGDNLLIIPGQPTLTITKDIAFGLVNGGFVTISEVQQSFHQIPEPTTMIAGALLLLPFGASTLRILRKNRTA